VRRRAASARHPTTAVFAAYDLTLICLANDATLLRLARSDQIADHHQAGRDADLSPLVIKR
jgi:hypothetical protein